MISDDLRKRIAAMNRRGPKERGETKEREPQTRGEPGNREPIVLHRRPVSKKGGVRRADGEGRSVRAEAQTASESVSLGKVALGNEVENDAGRFLLIDRSYVDRSYGHQSFGTSFPDARKFCAHYGQAISSLTGASVPHDVRGSLGSLLEAAPEDLIYVDIEATGLNSATPLFLVGVLVYVDGELRIQQLLARDYTEEPALLAHFSEILDASSVLITFNGKSYDMPYIRDRSLFFGVPFQLPQAHIDMVHEGRSRWRERLPNCKLQTLERHICLRARTGDIPGAEIPDAYHRFVRTGNAVQIRDILHHNALDLVTMAEVLLFILEGREL